MTRSGRSGNDVVSAMVQARLEAGMTQADLASLMCTTQSAIARVESGRMMPTVATLKKWAELTGKRLEIRFI